MECSNALAGTATNKNYVSGTSHFDYKLEYYTNIRHINSICLVNDQLFQIRSSDSRAFGVKISFLRTGVYVNLQIHAIMELISADRETYGLADRET